MVSIVICIMYMEEKEIKIKLKGKHCISSPLSCTSTQHLKNILHAIFIIDMVSKSLFSFLLCTK